MFTTAARPTPDKGTKRNSRQTRNNIMTKGKRPPGKRQKRSARRSTRY